MTEPAERRRREDSPSWLEVEAADVEARLGMMIVEAVVAFFVLDVVDPAIPGGSTLLRLPLALLEVALGWVDLSGSSRQALHCQSSLGSPEIPAQL